MRKIALVSALAVLTVSGAACGGGDSDTLTEREYTRALERLCTSVQDDLDDIDTPEDDTDYRGIENLADDANAIVSDNLAELEDLKPPKELEADHEDYVASVQRTLDATDDLKAAAEDEDDDAIADALQTLTDEADERDAIADDIGATDCIEADEPDTPTTEAPDEPTTEAPDEPTTEAPDEPTTEAPDEPTTEAPEQTTPRITVPPVEMTMPTETQPPVAGTSIDTFDFGNLVTPSGYVWQNIDSESLAGIQDTFGSIYEGQIAAIGGAFVGDTATGTEFRAFAFFWNEDDIVASGTGIDFLNTFTGSAISSSDTFTAAGYPVTIWTDEDGAEGVGVIDSNVAVVLYGPSGTTQTMLDFFDAFIVAQG